jgi:hypothetical protein
LERHSPLPGYACAGICGWNMTQKWLSVIGALVREKAMLAKAGMKTVSEVQNLVLCISITFMQTSAVILPNSFKTIRMCHSYCFDTRQ